MKLNQTVLHECMYTGHLRSRKDQITQCIILLLYLKMDHSMRLSKKSNPVILTDLLKTPHLSAILPLLI